MFQQGFPAVADPIVRGAELELADAIMLAAEGDEGGDRRVVAALDIRAEELPALGKPEGVECRRAGEDRVRGEVSAHGRDLLIHAAKEGCFAITARVRRKTDVVDGCIRVGSV